MKIDLKQDAETIREFHQRFQAIVADHKEQLLQRIEDGSQRTIIHYYLNVLRELCGQICVCLTVRAYSAAEALSRVVIEQSANLLYVGTDGGARARALVKRSRTKAKNNGDNWVKYLDAHGEQNPAAQARQANAAGLLADFEARWPKVAAYPTSAELFREIGWENVYHAFYAPLCDSVHTFSDDLSNLVSIRELFSVSPKHGADMLTYCEKERRRLATYHAAVAVGLGSEAFCQVCQKMQLASPISEAMEVATDLQRLIDRHEQFDHSRI